MGHYASEMMCSRCGHLRCECPPPVDTTQNMWLVTNDLEVMKVCDFDRKMKIKYGGMRLNVSLLRSGTPLFATETDAQPMVKIVIDRQLAEARDERAKLDEKISMLLAKKASLKDE